MVTRQACAHQNNFDSLTNMAADREIKSLLKQHQQTHCANIIFVIAPFPPLLFCLRFKLIKVR